MLGEQDSRLPPRRPSPRARHCPRKRPVKGCAGQSGAHWAVVMDRPRAGELQLFLIEQRAPIGVPTDQLGYHIRTEYVASWVAVKRKHHMFPTDKGMPMARAVGQLVVHILGIRSARNYLASGGQ